MQLLFGDRVHFLVFGDEELFIAFRTIPLKFQLVAVSVFEV